ncbi:hypothetical protein ACS0TY_018998 [Phlomoides rotata]
MGIQQSVINGRKMQRYVFSSPHLGQRYVTQCVPLHKAALKGDWDAAQKLLANDPTLVTARVTEGKEIALHVAAVEGHYNFVDNLVNEMDEKDLGIQNAVGCTALSWAAAAGHIDIAKLLVRVNANLPTIKGENGITPLYLAALQGFNEMAEYLYPLSAFQDWTPCEQIKLLTTLIDNELYGLAMVIVEEHGLLAIDEDENGDTPLEVLARKPLSSDDAYALFDCLWEIAVCQDDIELGKSENLTRLFFVAAHEENEEFLIELIRRYPDFLYKVNLKHSIFHIAVARRYVKVFNLMCELGGVKDLIATYKDEEGNNILHLAAKLAPRNQLNSIPGAALQMQTEVLWYREVEKLVRPSYRSKTNSAGQTPYDLFMAEHYELMREGEKLMKQTAKYCMLVTMLITTVVFTADFTVPGGYDNDTGVPILETKKLFMVFPVSVAVATLSSLTSMLMFLSILTSRYSVDDFLKSLPFWLVIGVTSLFVSIVAMMVAFCSSLLFFHHGRTIITILLVFFAAVPIMFVILNYPLLFTILRRTYSCRWLFRSNHQLHV